MESKLVFLLLLICVSYTVGQDSSGSTEGGERTEPCSVDDMECIRDYFASSNQCTKTSHEDGDEIKRDLLVAYLPKFNCSIICIDDTLKLFGTSIEKFYVNEQSQNLVMTVNFEGINVYTPRANFVLQLRGEEPEVVEDYVNVTYSGAMTAIIPHTGLRGIGGAAVFAFNTNAMPPFEIGPKVSDSSVEEVSNFYNALVSDIPTAVQELLLTKAPYFFYVYLQEYICNYGYEFTGEIMH